MAGGDFGAWWADSGQTAHVCSPSSQARRDAAWLSHHAPSQSRDDPSQLQLGYSVPQQVPRFLPACRHPEAVERTELTRRQIISQRSKPPDTDALFPNNTPYRTTDPSTPYLLLTHLRTYHRLRRRYSQDVDYQLVYVHGSASVPLGPYGERRHVRGRKKHIAKDDANVIRLSPSSLRCPLLPRAVEQARQAAVPRP